MSERSDKSSTTLPGPIFGSSANSSAEDRRTTPRYPFKALAMVFELRTEARVTGRSSDLGLGGCYMDTICPFPKGTRVRIYIERERAQFEALAVVTYAHASMGMGMVFTEITPKYQAVLHEWIAELGGERIPESAALPSSTETGMLVSIGILRKVLNQLIDLMIRGNLITEKEAAGLLRQMFR